MEIVAALVVLTLIGLLFYAIREPERWNWRRPATAPQCTVCGSRHWPVEECDLR